MSSLLGGEKTRSHVHDCSIKKTIYHGVNMITKLILEFLFHLGAAERPGLRQIACLTLGQFRSVMVRNFILFFCDQIFDSSRQAANGLNGIASIHHFQKLVLSHFLLLLIQTLFLGHQFLHALEILFAFLVAVFVALG